MIYLKYKDFDETYQKLTRFPLQEIKDETVFEIGASQYISDLIVETESFEIKGPLNNLGNLNYTKMKWNVLLKKYIDNDSYFSLKKRLVESKHKTLTFNFNIHVGDSSTRDQTKNKDSCLICLVFGRNKTSGPWTRASVTWRSSEIFQKFAVDLMLLNRMFNDLPNLDLKNIFLHFAQCFWSSFKLCELIDSPLFSVEEFKNSKTFLGKKLFDHYIRYYGEGAKLSNFHAIRRKQEAKLNHKENAIIPLEDLKMPSEEPGVSFLRI